MYHSVEDVANPSSENFIVEIEVSPINDNILYINQGIDRLGEYNRELDELYFEFGSISSSTLRKVSDMIEAQKGCLIIPDSNSYINDHRNSTEPSSLFECPELSTEPVRQEKAKSSRTNGN